MSTGERMKSVRKARGLSAEAVAKKLGVSPATVYRYEKGDIEKVPGDLLEPLSSILGTTPAYLMGWTDDAEIPMPAGAAYNISAREYSMVRSYRRAEPADKQIIDNIIARYPVDEIPEVAPVEDKIIPLFGTAAAAGPGEMDTGLPWEDYAVPADSPADFAIRISGDSMEPVLHDGQIALCAEKTPQIGDVAVFMVNGAMLVKQFIADNFGNIYLRSVNRDRRDADLDIMASGNDTVTCYGTVLLPQRPPLPLD